MTARTRQQGQDSKDRTVGTRRQGQDSRRNSAETGQTGHFSGYRLTCPPSATYFYCFPTEDWARQREKATQGVKKPSVKKTQIVFTDTMIS
jgi:hypothetical protein